MIQIKILNRNINNGININNTVGQIYRMLHAKTKLVFDCSQFDQFREQLAAEIENGPPPMTKKLKKKCRLLCASNGFSVSILQRKQNFPNVGPTDIFRGEQDFYFFIF